MIESLPIPEAETSAYAERARSNTALFDRLPRNDSEWLEIARSTRPDRAARERLWSVLRPHWDEIDLPVSSRDLVATLDECPTAAIIMSGQQPAIAGGTLLHLSKALCAGVLAQRLRDRGEPAVAIMWVADEDHDAGELFGGLHPRGDGQLEVANPFSPGRVMIERFRFFDDGQSVLDELDALGVGDAPWFALLERTRSASPAIWYRDFMLQALVGVPLLPVHPAWIRSLQGESFAEELRHPGRLRDEVDVSCQILRQHAVASPIPEADRIPLFFVGDDGRRHRMNSRGDRVVLRADPTDGFPSDGVLRAELEEWARREPARFSPDALLRPLIQDRLFEPAAVVTGPTEMAYQLELIESYRERSIARPVPFHRLRTRVISEREQQILDEFDLEIGQLQVTVDWAELVPSHEATALRVQMDDRIGALRGWLNALADDEGYPPALRKRVERLARRLASDREKLRAAIEREVSGSVAPARKQLAGVHRSLWVRKLPAERVVSVLEYSRRFGASLLPALVAAYDPYDERERVLVLPERSKIGAPSMADESEPS